MPCFPFECAVFVCNAKFKNRFKIVFSFFFQCGFMWRMWYRCMVLAPVQRALPKILTWYESQKQSNDRAITSLDFICFVENLWQTETNWIKSMSENLININGRSVVKNVQSNERFQRSNCLGMILIISSEIWWKFLSTNIAGQLVEINNFDLITMNSLTPAQIVSLSYIVKFLVKNAFNFHFIKFHHKKGHRTTIKYFNYIIQCYCKFIYLTPPRTLND